MREDGRCLFCCAGGGGHVDHALDAHCRGRPVVVVCACVGCGCVAAMALSWNGTIHDDGLVASRVVQGGLLGVVPWVWRACRSIVNVTVSYVGTGGLQAFSRDR